jgi:hypothetical protein
MTSGLTINRLEKVYYIILSINYIYLVTYASGDHLPLSLFGVATNLAKYL